VQRGVDESRAPLGDFGRVIGFVLGVAPGLDHIIRAFENC
jgi:hypothetical protein